MQQPRIHNVQLYSFILVLRLIFAELLYNEELTKL